MSDEAVDQGKGNSNEDADEDWLESDDDTATHSSATQLSSMKVDYAMASRDSTKVQDKMYDVSAKM